MTHKVKMTRSVVKDRKWTKKPNGLFGYRSVATTRWDCSLCILPQPQLVNQQPRVRGLVREQPRVRSAGVIDRADSVDQINVTRKRLRS